jgi:hypothetical protein
MTKTTGRCYCEYQYRCNEQLVNTEHAISSWQPHNLSADAQTSRANKQQMSLQNGWYSNLLLLNLNKKGLRFGHLRRYVRN